MALKIYIIAGEASGDNIGAKLMNKMKEQNPNIEFYGIGGEKMQAEGINLLFSSKEISVMGFLEIIPSIPGLLNKINLTAKHIYSLQPDAVITIDSPGFSFRVAKKIKPKISGKLIHYVAPTVWAYKPGRAKKIAQIYDHLLVILPFEPPYFLKEGLETSFVGHPAIENLQTYPREKFRSKYNIAAEETLVCVTPGSRKQEIQTLLPIFLDAIKILQTKINNKIRIAIPTQFYQEVSQYDNSKIIIIDDSEKEQLFSSADLALTKSGTITSELAFYQLPMVIAHKVNKFSAWLLRKMLKVKYVTIINIIAGKKLIPELLQEQCTPEKIAEELYLKITKKDAFSQELHEVLEKLKVGSKPPSKIAATKILALLS